MKNSNLYTSTFDIAFNCILSVEGGYVNDPNDAGGETKFGISKRTFPDLNIKSLTTEDAKSIYWHNYWLKCRADELKLPVALMVFDAFVQHNPKSAARLLQGCLSTARDGVIGSHTIAQANATSITELTFNFQINRAELYREICLANTANSKFFRGWMRRLFMLDRLVVSLKNK